jgi:hypothetical protein
MSVQRLSKYSSAEPFTMVPNATIADTRLGPKALGLLVFMLSKPDGWTFREETIAKQMGVSRAQIRTAMARLLELGYVQRFWSRGESTPVQNTVVYDILPEVRNPDNPEHGCSESVPLSKTEDSKKLAGTGEYYVRTLAAELAEKHNREVQLSDSSLGDTYLAVARTASQVYDESVFRGQIIGLTVELLERAFGSLPKNGRGMVARLVTTNRPIVVLEAAAKTTGAAVGADERYADDPMGPVRYLSGILRSGR